MISAGRPKKSKAKQEDGSNEDGANSGAVTRR
eukprot:CAMPEP_0184534452 /NCGR_PEP_ID=MMETSP0198_2-20121128/15338_1 /TAXON_ID=1112570 /ORGANISM="Thraustochytrium sp., Strain LLF1b" /LENGTH=31 /DNA_ID= /DNA_START= /DNA_END= /DNA_ORIENTATION=